MVSRLPLLRDLGLIYADYLDVERYRPGTIAAYRDWWTVSCDLSADQDPS